MEETGKTNPLGVWTHPKAHVSLHVTQIPQADAMLRMGYEFDEAATKAWDKAKADEAKAKDDAETPKSK